MVSHPNFSSVAHLFFLFVGVVLVFVGLTISNLEPENLASVLHRPLLSNSEAQEVSQYVPFTYSLFGYKAHGFFEENLFFCGKFMPKLGCVL